MPCPTATTSHARALRWAMTPAERTLWHHLRDRRLCGLKFRRQAPLGPYIADFYCAERRLIVEADGFGHGGRNDAVRDAWFARRGIRTLRLWNTDIRPDPEPALRAVLAAAEAADG